LFLSIGADQPAWAFDGHHGPERCLSKDLRGLKRRRVGATGDDNLRSARPTRRPHFQRCFLSCRLINLNLTSTFILSRFAALPAEPKILIEFPSRYGPAVGREYLDTPSAST
jgi:hypothetical protein